MAFDFGNLSDVAAVNQGRLVASYITSDSLATVMAAGYFNAVVDKLGVGDVIMVNAAGTPWTLAVTANSGSAITVGDASANAPITAKAVDFAVGAADTAKTTFTNVGAVATVTGTLPAATAGMEVAFYRSATQTLRVEPNGSNTIGAGGAGKYLSIDTDKGYVRLRCIVAAHWVVVDSAGTITFEE